MRVDLGLLIIIPGALIVHLCLNSILFSATKGSPQVKYKDNTL